MTWTTGKTWVAGEGVLASHLRRYIQSNMRHNVAIGNMKALSYRPPPGSVNLRMLPSFTDDRLPKFGPLGPWAIDRFAGWEGLNSTAGYQSIPGTIFTSPTRGLSYWYAAFGEGIEGSTSIRFLKSEPDTYFLVQFAYSFFFSVSNAVGVAPICKIIQDGATVLSESSKTGKDRRSELESVGSNNWFSATPGGIQTEYPDDFNYPFDARAASISQHYTIAQLSVVERPGLVPGNYIFLPGGTLRDVPTTSSGTTAGTMNWNADDYLSMSVWEVYL